ncbi:hypothetical protein PGB90_003676 [Kerria lacca]
MAKRNSRLCQTKTNDEFDEIEISEIKKHRSNKNCSKRSFQNKNVHQMEILSSEHPSSPVPIINEFSESDRSKIKSSFASKHNRNMKRIRGTLAEFGNTGIASENAAAIALQESANNMHAANVSLKTSLNRLMCDNEQLNVRMSRMCQKNRHLALERERLLTTLENTAVMLQSTVNSMSREPCLELEEVQKDKSADSKSVSDMLERSTKFTIKEFDNLLNALQSNDREQKPPTFYSAGCVSTKSKKLSQYDIIVKWLNNETTQQSHSTNNNDHSSSSTSVVSVEIDKILENKRSNGDNSFNEKTHNMKNDLVVIETNLQSKQITESVKETDRECVTTKEDNIIIPFQEIVDERKEVIKNISDHKVSPLKIGYEKELTCEYKKYSPISEKAIPNTAEKSQQIHTCCNSIFTSSVTKLNDNLETNDDEHEEFLGLCNTMMKQMDSMISKPSKCNSQSAQVMDFLLNEKKSPNLKISPKKEKCINKRKRRCMVRLTGDEVISSNSSLSLTDFGEVVNGKESLKTFQQCLVQLEQMNIRRTNKALTQTLIIKTLRKLLARQNKELGRNFESEDEVANLPSNEAIEVRNNKLEPRMESFKLEDTILHSDAEQMEKIRNSGTWINEASHPSDILQVFNRVSKSIIYHNGYNNFINLKDKFSSYPQFIPNTLSNAVNDRKLKISTRCCDNRKCKYELNTSKISNELMRLQYEDNRPISLYWFYPVLAMILSQFGIFRLFKYFGNLIFRS